jgi:hypothetical protein
MKALLKALAGFQSECPAVKKSADNPFFKSKYATLDAIQHHIQPHLTKYGLVVVQKNITTENGLYVMTEVYESASSESISSVFPIIVQKNTPQEYGSAVSYAKRYSLSGLLNLMIADEDDDGNASSQEVTIIAEKPSEKIWLNEGTEAFEKVKKFVTEGGKLTDVRKKFNVSKKIADLLMASAKIS